jgi:FAS-associated factor 2
MESVEQPHEESVELFKSVAALDDDETARAILAAHNWNIERAVDAFLTHGVAAAQAAQHQTQEGPLSTPSRFGGAQPDVGEAAERAHAEEGEFAPVTALPSSGAAATSRAPSRALQTHRGAAPQGILTHLRRLVLLPFQTIRMVFTWCAALLSRILGINRFYGYPSRSQAVGAAAVAEFEAHLRSRHGPDVRYPAIFRGTFKEALSHSTQTCRLVLLYLHSEIHHVSDRFVREILSDEGFIQFVNENFVFYAASVNRSVEATELASYFTPAGYPYLAIVYASRRWPLGQLIDLRVLSDLDRSMRGGRDAPITAMDVLLWLQNVLLEYGDALRTARSMREQRQSSQQLREEQDREFQQALAADQAAERARQEAERRAREEAAEREQSMRERAERLERKKAALAPEPEYGPNVVTVLLRLPDGQSKQRRFDASTALAELFDWAETCCDVDFDRFVLTTNFPKRIFSPASHATMTLTEAGFERRLALLVTENLWAADAQDISGKSEVPADNESTGTDSDNPNVSIETKKHV